MFVEGGYNRRLEVIVNSGSPAGKTRWIFDQTEMAEAKKKFGNWACVGGNVPSNLFKVGTAEQMEVYVKERIESCAPGGGFFLSPGAVLDQAKGENIHTDLRNARECGAYETHNDSMGESLQRIDAKTRPFAFSALCAIKPRRTLFRREWHECSRNF
jgi:hypothetical protein